MRCDYNFPNSQGLTENVASVVFPLQPHVISHMWSFHILYQMLTISN